MSTSRTDLCPVGAPLRTGRTIIDLIASPSCVIVQHHDAARVYDAASRELVRELDTGRLESHEGGLAWVGGDVVSIAPTRIARIDLATGKRIAERPLSGGGGCVITSDGRVLLTHVEEAVCVLSEWTAGGALERIARLDEHQEGRELAYAANGSVLVSLRWLVARVSPTGEVWRSPSEDLVKLVARSRPLPLAEGFAVGVADGRVQFWSGGATPSLVVEVRVGPETWLPSVHLASLHDGAYVAVTAADQRISILAPGDLAPRRRLAGARDHLGPLAAVGSRLWASAGATVLAYEVPAAGLSTSPPTRSKPKLSLKNHPTFVQSLGVVGPGRVVSGDVDGGLCVWERGQEDALTYRAPKRSLPIGFAAITSVAVAGGAVVVRDGRAGFVVLDTEQLGVIARLPHKDAETVLACGDVVVTTGGRRAQAFRAGTWEVVGRRDRLGAGTQGYAWVPAANTISFRDDAGTPQSQESCRLDR